MSDNFEHNPGDHEDPLAGPTWIVGFLGAVLLIVIVLGITALFYNADKQEVVHKVVNRDPQELIKLREDQKKRLEAPPHLQEVAEKNDKGEDVVVKSLVIPIKEAKEHVIAEFASNSSAHAPG